MTENEFDSILSKGQGIFIEQDKVADPYAFHKAFEYIYRTIFKKEWQLLVNTVVVKPAGADESELCENKMCPYYDEQFGNYCSCGSTKDDEPYFIKCKFSKIQRKAEAVQNDDAIEMLKIAVAGWERCYRAYGIEVMNETKKETAKKLTGEEDWQKVKIYLSCLEA